MFSKSAGVQVLPSFLLSTETPKTKRQLVHFEDKFPNSGDVLTESQCIFLCLLDSNTW